MLKQSKNSSEVSESPEVVLEEKMGLKDLRKFVGWCRVKPLEVYECIRDWETI